jgi:hypothetical protein
LKWALSFAMISSFDGWSAYDIVGPLSKAEIRAILLDYGIERKWFRSWNSIEEMLLGSSDEVKRVVYRSAVTKRNVEDAAHYEMKKRKREARKEDRSVHRCIGFSFLLRLV